MKRLFLASEAKHPKSMLALEEFVGGFKGKSIAYIPTAANGELSFGSWKTDSETWDLINTLGANVEPVVLEDYKNKSVLSHLVDKDIIWFAGGMCGYLMYWIRRCEIDKNIWQILENGAIYVGSSAGGMVCSTTLTVAEMYPGDCETGAAIIPGLGLIDFDIFPHYEDQMREPIEKLYKGKALYLLKNGEAISIVDTKIVVLGEERILKSL